MQIDSKYTLKMLPVIEMWKNNLLQVSNANKTLVHFSPTIYISIRQVNACFNKGQKNEIKE